MQMTFSRNKLVFVYATVVCTIVLPCVASAQLSVSTYGAKCNWNGSTGTDDTSAFQAAATAATNLYNSSGATVALQLPTGKSCVVGGTVTVGSGVHFVGPGTIVVPSQTGGTLLFQNADNVAVEGLTFDVISGPGGMMQTFQSLVGEITPKTQRHTQMWLSVTTPLSMGAGVLWQRTPPVLDRFRTWIFQEMM